MDTIALKLPLNGPDWVQLPQVVVLGHFDGIHTGHVQVIQRGLEYGRKHQLPVSLMTFQPHPKSVFGVSGYDRYLTPLQEKERVLAQLGLNHLYVVHFDLTFAQVPAQTFAEALCKMGVQHAVVGFDYRFGHGGEGTAERLQEWGQGCFTVDIVPAHVQDGIKVSSSRVRDCLAEGDITKANMLLGRPYTVRGEVIHGDARGRTIGFPTANVKQEEAYMIPRNGVYAVQVLVKGQWFDGVMNVGVKPTFKSGEHEPTMEAHLFDFDDDIYGETVTIAIKHYIRSERKFSSVNELIDQIRSDAEQARELLAGLNETAADVSAR
ncbi:bifunctional riboflavin kinase/FAD synthetase [Paenibacillus sp. 481]|uniref:bifunctional riboflavin kinase/FAD synthetase n=1 Tax=Paenibacillus sp. 481 TaxID=2835869 RepID=UPI001E485655|nr:bifunctional riboflavin kinase/FAD synthetase [Paenibacillus sp. 481]UHA73891.1 bifunctional riboflavin kinase/FAD synthetase [Paenibacillus sp. 481]